MLARLIILSGVSIITGVNFPDPVMIFPVDMQYGQDNLEDNLEDCIEEFFCHYYSVLGRYLCQLRQEMMMNGCPREMWTSWFSDFYSLNLIQNYVEKCSWFSCWDDSLKQRIMELFSKSRFQGLRVERDGGPSQREYLNVNSVTDTEMDIDIQGIFEISGIFFLLLAKF